MKTIYVVVLFGGLLYWFLAVVPGLITGSIWPSLFYLLGLGLFGLYGGRLIRTKPPARHRASENFQGF